jgi:hypothetical protein
MMAAVSSETSRTGPSCASRPWETPCHIIMYERSRRPLTCVRPCRYNQSGVPVLLEDCGNDFPMHAIRLADGTVDCPMNQFRCSDDLHPVWHSVVNNLNATRAFNGANLTGPGCWAYPVAPSCISLRACSLSLCVCVWGGEGKGGCCVTSLRTHTHTHTHTHMIMI